MNFKYLLAPEQSTKLVKLFHKSSYGLLPLTFATYGFSFTDSSIVPALLQSTAVINFGFHSYVSTSFVISDYIKPKYIQNSCRFLNLKSHMIATIGFLYYFTKKYK